MKVKFKPESAWGKWSIRLIVAFFIFLGLFALAIGLGARGGATYFSNLTLAIPFTIAWVCAIGSFGVGLASVIKQKERSVFVFLAIGLGLLILLWVLAEVLFPH
jgi:hypothetical protein